MNCLHTLKSRHKKTIAWNGYTFIQTLIALAILGVCSASILALTINFQRTAYRERKLVVEQEHIEQAAELIKLQLFSQPRAYWEAESNVYIETNSNFTAIFVDSENFALFQDGKLNVEANSFVQAIPVPAPRQAELIMHDFMEHPIGVMLSWELQGEEYTYVISFSHYPISLSTAVGDAR